jgi:hypothetical protein
MATEPFIRRCRNCYAKLLRLYPKVYRERFGEGMKQTFNDLCRERVKAERGIFCFALWMFFETSTAIIRENLAINIMQNKSIVRVALRSGLILLIPLLGNLFVDGWNWSPFDFIVWGALVFGAGLTYELVAKKMSNKAYRFAVGLAVGSAFILIWVNLAVEIIGDNNPANLMFFGVPIVGIIGAAIARFQPCGMARALFATALAQALVPVIALMIWNPRVTSWAPGVLRVFGLNTFFVMLFAGSALLFRYASAKHQVESAA